jgi:hypothetical protein
LIGKSLPLSKAGSALPTRQAKRRLLLAIDALDHLGCPSYCWLNPLPQIGRKVRASHERRRGTRPGNGSVVRHLRRGRSSRAHMRRTSVSAPRPRIPATRQALRMLSSSRPTRRDILRQHGGHRPERARLRRGFPAAGCCRVLRGNATLGVSPFNQGERRGRLEDPENFPACRQDDF